MRARGGGLVWVRAMDKGRRVDVDEGKGRRVVGVIE